MGRFCADVKGYTVRAAIPTPLLTIAAISKAPRSLHHSTAASSSPGGMPRRAAHQQISRSKRAAWGCRET